MGKLIIDLLVIVAACGLGYLAGISHHFSDVVTKKTVRIGDKFFRITKVGMSEKEAE